MSGAWKWTLEDGLGILELDLPGTEVNVLTTENLTELRGILEGLQHQSGVKAMLVTSAKSRFFIAGADIKEIRGISTREDAIRKAEQGKEVFALLEGLKFPTVAVINGACLGGGYELALACTYRTASFSPHVKIGLPEVNLGILPGFGGSIRLPRLLGMLKAMPLILAGKIVSAEDALKNGMVDRLFPEKNLRAESAAFARSAAESGRKGRKPRKKDLMTQFFEETPVGRSIVFRKARKDIAARTKGFYPAPLEILELLSKTRGSASAQAYRLESEHFANLAGTPVSKALIKVFFMSEKYKKHPWTAAAVRPREIRKCGVLGAGVMGGGIAQLITSREIPVRVKDLNEKALGGALKEAAGIYKSALKRKRMKKADADRKMSLISVGVTDQGLGNCDVVIEAVVEDLKIKQKVFHDISSRIPADALLVSNTSSLPVTQMGAVAKNPERVAGLHFFNPVNRMPLVEVIRAEQTTDETLERVIQFARGLGKTVIVTRDAPGFLVNRLLLPYMNEAAYLLEEGLSAESVDRIAENFGMPMGPVELVDQVGIDVGYKVAHILQDAFGERMKVAPILEDVKNRGLLGKKAGRGFYVYQGKKKSINPEVKTGTHPKTVSEDDALKRMIYVMINEAARCLEEKVIDSASTVDIGMIMGTGFPPFRGGLLNYADSVGTSKIAEDLKRFSRESGSCRFSPCPYLENLASQGKGFHD